MTSIGGVSIEPLDIWNLTDAQIAAINAYMNALRAEARPEDPPTPLEETAAFLRNVPTFIEVHAWAGHDDAGRMVCGAQAIGFKEGENQHVLQCNLGVFSPIRRRGIGRVLLREIAGVAVAANKRLLVGNTSERVQAGAAFCLRVGAQPGLNAHTNRLELTDVDRAMVRRWVEEGPQRAPEYELTGFDGRCPDDLVDAVVDVLDVMNDAPRDDLQMEDQHLSVDQFREMERMNLAQGNEPWRLYVRHRKTGALVGLTEVDWNANQLHTIWQGNTGVRPEHRGKALGKWLKAAMLERVFAERSEATEIRTGNADSNAAMLAINRQLGFKPYIASTAWQADIETVQAYLHAVGRADEP